VPLPAADLARSIPKAQNDAPEERAKRNSTMKYDVILADPPWRYNGWRTRSSGIAERQYRTLPLEDICALPVGDLAAPNCALFLWAVSPTLLDYPAKVIAAWGFDYKTCAFIWIKTVRDSLRPRLGLGHYTRSASESCLLAIRGSMPVDNHSVSQVIHAPITRHSEKPQEHYQRIERLYPDASKIELFARRRRPGWDAWGDEVDSDIAIPSLRGEGAR